MTPKAQRRSAQPKRSVWPIIGYEAAERFAFYGLLTPLAVLMTAVMVPAATDAQVASYTAWFGTGVYLLAFVGAIVAETLVGRFRTVIVCSLIAAAGYAVPVIIAARGANLPGQWPILAAGVGLLAVAIGAIKPSIAAHLGDQFSEASQHSLAKTFGWFYFVIHAAPLLATAVAQHLLANSPNGLRWALVVPLIATLAGVALLWSGRPRFIRVAGAGRGFTKELFSREAGGAILRLLGVYLFVGIFWTAWRGAADAWPRQAERMDLRLFDFELLPQQIGMANIVFILLLVPLLFYVIYPLAQRLVAVTPLRKVAAGLFVAALSFVVAAGVQHAIDGGATPSVGWQLLAWALLTAAEVMVIVTALELSYTWAPPRIKSVVIAIWLLTFGIQDLPVHGRISGAATMGDFNRYMFFAIVMFAATAVFSVVSLFYKEKTYLQSQTGDEQATEPVRVGGAPT